MGGIIAALGQRDDPDFAKKNPRLIQEVFGGTVGGSRSLSNAAPSSIANTGQQAARRPANRQASLSNRTRIR